MDFGVLLMHVADRDTALQAQLVARIAPCGVNGPAAMRRVPEERVLGTIGQRFLVDRKLLSEIEEPGMIQVELLPPGKGAPGPLVLHLVLERCVGLPFPDLAVPRLLINLFEALRMLL